MLSDSLHRFVPSISESLEVSFFLFATALFGFLFYSIFCWCGCVIYNLPEKNCFNLIIYAFVANAAAGAAATIPKQLTIQHTRRLSYLKFDTVVQNKHLYK